jgi:hypothetical protein
MKKVLIMLFALCMGFAYADDVPENKIVSSKEYVDSQLVDKQPVFGANENNVAVFTDTAGTVTNKPVSTTLTNNSALPTVSAVNSGLDTKQNEISTGNTNTVVTYTSEPGTLGAKGIYQDSGTYASQTDSLIDAGTFNEALRTGLENEFVCANRPDAYDPVTGNC